MAFVCLSFPFLPCPPPLLSSLHLHRPKNRPRLGLGLISLWGFLVGSCLWPDKVGTGPTRVPQMPLSCYRSGCSGLSAPLTLALDTFPCSLPKMLSPGHGGCQAEPRVSPCMAPLLHLGWAGHQLQRCPCGTGRAERYPQSPSSYSPKVPGVRKWSHRDALVTWLGLQPDLALPPGQLWVSRGCSVPPAPQAGSSPRPLGSVEQDEHQFGTSLCPPARSPSCYE